MPPREPQPLFWPMDHSVQNHQNTPSPPRGSSGIGPERHRNVDILIPLARQRESPTGPNVPCERRTDPAEPHRPQAPGASPGTPPPQHRCGPPGVCGVPSERTDCAPYPGVSPRAGLRSPVGALQTPHLSQSPHRLRVPTFPTAPTAITTTHRINDDCFSSTATIKPSHTGTYPQSTKRQRDRAGASIGTSTS